MKLDKFRKNKEDKSVKWSTLFHLLHAFAWACVVCLSVRNVDVRRSYKLDYTSNFITRMPVSQLFAVTSP